MELTIKRSDIYYAELNPVIGSEQGGTRPVLIISNDIGNKHSPTVIIAPITSRIHTKAKLMMQNMQLKRILMKERAADPGCGGRSLIVGAPGGARLTEFSQQLSRGVSNAGLKA